jgi:hypothetical protein
MTGNIHKLIEISYEIICAAALRPPNKEYLELLAHPERITPYKPNPESANK